MSNLLIRIAAGIFAVCGGVVGSLIVVLEGGWRKAAAIPIFYLSWRFAKYATTRAAWQEEGIRPSALWRILAAAFTLVIVLIITGDKFGSQFRVLMVAGIVSVTVLIMLIAHRCKWRFIRNLLECDCDTQDRILAQLDPMEREKILRLLGRARMDS